MDYMASVIEKIIVERNEKVDSAILGEIQQIAVENGIETKIVLNEKSVADALRNYQDGYATVRAEVAREIFEEIAIIGVLQHGFNEKHIVMHIDFELLKELKKKYTGRCTDCKHFVGCECFSGMTCDEYTEVEG